MDNARRNRQESKRIRMYMEAESITAEAIIMITRIMEVEVEDSAASKYGGGN